MWYMLIWMLRQASANTPSGKGAAFASVLAMMYCKITPLACVMSALVRLCPGGIKESR